MSFRLSTRLAQSAALAGAVFLAAPLAHAGGYDTPMLYSARHMGMGGTAIGYVDDPSAIFHNPAGLGQIERGEVIGDFSLLLGKIHASPADYAQAKNIDSDLTVAPFFLVGGAYRIQKYLVLGVGVYPVASAGATFNYPAFAGGNVRDHTELLFLEASPALSFNPLPNLRFGLGYRFTYVKLDRFTGADGQDPSIDFSVKGTNFLGFRVGAQFAPVPWWQFGAVFRNKVNTKLTSSTGVALGNSYTDVSTHFMLPAKLGAGTRVDFDRFGVRGSVAADYEYDFNGENTGDPLVGTPAPGTNAPSSVANIFAWKNSQTVRLGLEYRVWHDGDIDHVPLRVGYIYDTQVGNPKDPTAFGTPPGPTQVFTLGSGYNAGTWQANLAYAYRFGTGDVPKSGLDPNCAFCSFEGSYSIHLSGIYVDASYKF